MGRDVALTPDEEAAVRAFMQRLAVSAAPVQSLSSAHTVLRQASWRRRWEGERRMHAPLDFMVPLQIAAGLAAVGLLLFRALPLLAVTLH